MQGRAMMRIRLTVLLAGMLLVSQALAQGAPEPPVAEETASSTPEAEAAPIVAEEPAEEEAATEEAATEEAATEEAATEEAATEEAATEEAATEEAATEETSGDDATAETDLPPAPEWYTDFEGLNEAYVRISTDYQTSLRDYMRGEIQAMIDAAGDNREDQILQLREVEATRRQEAIATMESFVARYGRYKSDPQYREHIADTLFKLAELHRDQAEYRMDMDSRLYDERMKEYEWGVRPSPPNEADADYGRALAMYKRVVDEFKDYRYRDMVMYLMGYYLRLSEDLDGSTAVLAEMAQTYQDSYYRLAGLMLLGHNYYDLSNYKKAVEAYRIVASVKENNDAYEDALYRLGWASFEEFKYEQAINSFLLLLDYGEESKGKKKQRLALRREAIESIANSFVDADWDGDDLPDADYGPERALRYVSRGVPYEKEIILAYANLLYDLQDAEHYRHAVIAFREYLKRDPLDPNAPEVHDRMVYAFYELSRSAHPSISEADRALFAEQAMLERKRMAELYGKDTKWAELHRYNAKALDLAASKLSANLLDRAQLLHQQAQEIKEESGDVAARTYYQKAAEAYGDFLDQFPKSPRFLEMLERYASVEMFGLANYERAAELYGQLRDSKLKGNTYVEDAANAVLEARARIIKNLEAGQDPENPIIPAKIFDAAEGSTLADIQMGESKDPTAPRTVVPKEIPEPVLKWMEEAQRFIGFGFKGKDNHEANGLLAFQIAKIYFRYGHFDKAREQYNQVLSQYRENELLKVYCYTDLARTYRFANDLDNLEKVSLEMKEEVKGEAETVDAILGSIKDARLKSRFQRAGALLEQAKAAKDAEQTKEARELYSRAAWELEKIVDENPTFDKADVALLEAGRSFEEVKLFEKAAQVYKRLVDEERFEKSDYRENAVKLLAENYEKFFNFASAVRTYQRLATDYPKGKDAKAALLKTALLYENDQQYGKAADVLEVILGKFPGDELAGKMTYSLISLHERGGDADAARKAAERFVKKFGRDGTLINQTMAATLKLGRMAEDAGKKKDAQKYYRQVVKLYEDNGLEAGSRQAHLCAEAQFRLAESRFDEYAQITLEGKSKSQRQAVTKKREKLMELEAIYGQIANYQSNEWLVAAVFKVGMLWKDLSEALANAPYPPDLPQDEDFKFQYSIQIGDLKARFEDKARSLWRDGVEVSKKTGVYNEWTVKILVELNKYAEDRERYPLYRAEKKFEADIPLSHFPFVQ
jgi:tetratricopeptide (TPR) repeat protein